jgi:membrane protease YdiL (CAAX protease family)
MSSADSSDQLFVAGHSVGRIEEAGFRGYVQVALEREFRAPLAIVISALVMSPAHGLSQGFVRPTLLWYFLAHVMFGVMVYLSKSILPGIVIH